MDYWDALIRVSASQVRGYPPTWSENEPARKASQFWTRERSSNSWLPSLYFSSTMIACERRNRGRIARLFPMGSSMSGRSSRWGH
jgi:hypothetical protein